MEPRLVPVNAWLATLTGAGGWPTPLRQAGVQFHRLEVPITTAEGTVVADVLAASDQLRIIVPAEAKSGANVNEGQAKRYAAIKPEDVARLVTLSFPAREAQVELVYGCLDENYDRIMLGLTKVGIICSVFRVAETTVALETHGDSRLPNFDVAVPPGGPPRLVVLDAESPDDEFREILLPAVVAAASREIELVGVQTLLAQAIPYFDQQPERAQARLRDRAASVLREMIRTDFSTELRYEPAAPNTRGPSIRILRSPAGFDPRGETQGWQRWQRKAHQALRRRPKPAPAGQLSFEDLGLQAEAGEES